jgi:protein SCO1/2
MPVRPKVLVVFAIVAAAAGVLLARAALDSPVEPPVKATLLPKPQLLPQLELLDQDGKLFDRQRLERHWSLLFFGFSRCPAVCPATLNVLALTRERLASLPAAQRPQVVLVSVDPKHDSPARLKGYVSSFNPEFVGVTGSEAAIEQLAHSLGVSITMQPLADDDYTVEHTQAIFLVDPRGAWRAVFTTPHSPNVIADDYRRILAMD